MEIIILLLTIINLMILLFLLLRKQNNTSGSEMQKQADIIISKMETGFASGREEAGKNFTQFRIEAAASSNLQQETIKSYFVDFMKFLQEFKTFIIKTEEDSAKQLAAGLQQYGERNETKLMELIKTLDEKIFQFRNAVLEENRQARKEQNEFQNQFREAMGEQMTRNRNAVDERLKFIQEENAKKLDEMKKTVDEKLRESMDKHFNESFKLISERLEQVHKGLGEMQSLAIGVGDLRKVLTNVKTRGNIGEIQLATLLNQYLSPDQFICNTATVPSSSEIVEFAIKLPGKKDEQPVLLPVDSKFPVEDYMRLMECFEQYPSTSQEVKNARKNFAQTVKKCASDIRSKYLYPPVTTAFALMFVPSEGIYAEILRVPGLFEALQNEFQISVVGPSNLVAFLNSLQLGFRTLAIEKHSNDVWQILGAVKTEFGKFGVEMDLTRRSLESVVNHMEKIGTRSRVMERKLRDVQELPDEQSKAILGDGAAEEHTPELS